jgi:LysM repeat protein
MRLRARRKRGEAPEGPGPEHAAPLTARKPEKKKPEKKAKSRKKRYPSGMTGYVVEFDDTVVTVANRFGVTWEDVVRANRLKPPYPLKVGEEILIPVHTLRNPEDEDGAH